MQAGHPDLIALHVRLFGQPVEEGAGVAGGADGVGGGHELAEDGAARLLVLEGLGHVDRLIGSGAPEHVGQQHEIAVGGEALAHLEQGRADRRRVHEEDHRRPGAAALGMEGVGAGVAVGGWNGNLLHGFKSFLGSIG
jgi:hypothetical protein